MHYIIASYRNSVRIKNFSHFGHTAIWYGLQGLQLFLHHGLAIIHQFLSRQSRKPSRVLFSGSPNSSRKAGLEPGSQPSKSTRLVFLVFHRHVYAKLVDNSDTVPNVFFGFKKLRLI
jgi:hypothetical protein